MKLENLIIGRLTVHKIFGRSKTVAVPFADECKNLCNLGTDGEDTLHKRISSSLNHKSKFFELDVEDTSKSSFFELQKELLNAKLPNFLIASQKIADKLAEAHEKTNIPDGLIIIIEAKIDGFESVICVKAEKSNAFSMTGNNLKLIKDIFLSSDKTLYKLGFCIKTDKMNTDKKSFKFFVYDDAFSPSKDDLAFYFYHRFMGLSTEKNSKIQTNKLHRALTNFANDHITFGDKFEVMRTIDRAFLDNRKKNLNIADFKSFFPEEVAPLFEATLEVEFPHSIVKNNAIINSIETKRISITDETTLLLKNAPEGIITGSTRVQSDLKKLRTSIDSGYPFQFALIPSAQINDLTKDINAAPKKK